MTETEAGGGPTALPTVTLCYMDKFFNETYQVAVV